MDEKIDLVEIDLSAIIKQTDTLTSNILKLEEANKTLRADMKKSDEELKKEGKTRASLGSEIEKNKESLKGLKKERADNIKLEKSEVNSLEQLKIKQSQLIKERSKLNLKTKEGADRLKEINLALRKNQDEINKNSAGFANFKGSMEGIQDSMSQMPGVLGRVGGGIRQLGVQFKALLANPIVLVIGAIVGAFTSLRAALKRSEEGQNALNKISAVLGATLNVFLDIVTTVAEKLVSAFSDPKQAVIDLWEAIKTNLVNRIEGLANLFVGLKDTAASSFRLIGASIKNVFTDNQAEVDKLKDEVVNASKVMGQALIQVGTGLDVEQQKAFIDGLKEIGEEIKREGAISADLANRQAALDKLIRESLVKEGELRRDIAELRVKAADKDNETAEARLKALDQAIAKENQVLELNQKIAQEKLYLKATQNALGASTKEDLEEEAQLRRALLDLETANALARKRLVSEQQTAIREISAEKMKAEAEESARILEATEKIQALRQDDLIKQAENLEAKKQLEIQYENEEFQRKLLNKDLLDIEIEALELEHKANLDKIDEDYNKKILDRDKKTQEEKKKNFQKGASIIQQGSSTLFSAISENERQNLELSLQAVEGNEEKQAEIRKEYAERGKKTSRANAIIGAALAIIQAFAQLGPIAGAVAAVGVATTTALQIRAIDNQKFANGGEVKAWQASGASHAQGGIPLHIGGKYAGEIEGNEGVYVVNKHDNPAAIASLSATNSVHGKPFAPRSYMQDGGEAVQQTVGISFEQALELQRAAPIFVTVTDINDGQSTQTKVVANGEI